jgi:hypothetical protein
MTTRRAPDAPLPPSYLQEGEYDFRTPSEGDVDDLLKSSIASNSRVERHEQYGYGAGAEDAGSFNNTAHGIPPHHACHHHTHLDQQSDYAASQDFAELERQEMLTANFQKRHMREDALYSMEEAIHLRCRIFGAGGGHIGGGGSLLEDAPETHQAASLGGSSGHEMILGPLQKYVFACNSYAMGRLRKGQTRPCLEWLEKCDLLVLKLSPPATSSSTPKGKASSVAGGQDGGGPFVAGRGGGAWDATTVSSRALSSGRGGSGSRPSSASRSRGGALPRAKQRGADAPERPPPPGNGSSSPHPGHSGVGGDDGAAPMHWQFHLMALRTLTMNNMGCCHRQAGNLKRALQYVPSFLPPFLPFFPPSFLPSFLVSFLLALHTSFLPSFIPSLISFLP